MEPLYTLEQVATNLGMSATWLRKQVRDYGVEHSRPGCTCRPKSIKCRHAIKFTPAQVERLKASFVKAPLTSAATTGRKRSA